MASAPRRELEARRVDAGEHRGGGDHAELVGRLEATGGGELKVLDAGEFGRGAGGDDRRARGPGRPRDAGELDLGPGGSDSAAAIGEVLADLVNVGELGPDLVDAGDPNASSSPRPRLGPSDRALRAACCCGLLYPSATLARRYPGSPIPWLAARPAVSEPTAGA